MSFISWSLFRLLSIESVMPSNHLILCHALLLLPSIFPSIRVFPRESALCIRWAKYWSFSFRISPSNEHLVLRSFRLSSPLEHHSSKASVLQCSALVEKVGNPSWPSPCPKLNSPWGSYSGLIQLWVLSSNKGEVSRYISGFSQPTSNPSSPSLPPCPPTLPATICSGIQAISPHN